MFASVCLSQREPPFLDLLKMACKCDTFDGCLRRQYYVSGDDIAGLPDISQNPI